jgi:hypothetical protein
MDQDHPLIKLNYADTVAVDHPGRGLFFGNTRLAPWRW